MFWSCLPGERSDCSHIPTSDAQHYGEKRQQSRNHTLTRRVTASSDQQWHFQRRPSWRLRWVVRKIGAERSTRRWYSCRATTQAQLQRSFARYSGQKRGSQTRWSSSEEVDKRRELRGTTGQLCWSNARVSVLLLVVDFHSLESWRIMHLSEIPWWADLNSHSLFPSSVASWLRIRNFACVIRYLHFIFNRLSLTSWITHLLYSLERVFSSLHRTYFDFTRSSIVRRSKNFTCLLLTLTGGTRLVSIECSIRISSPE